MAKSDNRARTREIRARMATTGERFTVAARAVDTARQGGYPWSRAGACKALTDIIADASIAPGWRALARRLLSDAQELRKHTATHKQTGSTESARGRDLVLAWYSTRAMAALRAVADGIVPPETSVLDAENDHLRYPQPEIPAGLGETPLLSGAMRGFNISEAAREAYDDAFGRDPDGECYCDDVCTCEPYYIPEYMLDQADELERQMDTWWGALEDFADAVAITLATDLRDRLIA